MNLPQHFWVETENKPHGKTWRCEYCGDQVSCWGHAAPSVYSQPFCGEDETVETREERREAIAQADLDHWRGQQFPFDPGRHLGAFRPYSRFEPGVSSVLHMNLLLAVDMWVAYDNEGYEARSRALLHDDCLTLQSARSLYWREILIGGDGYERR